MAINMILCRTGKPAGERLRKDAAAVWKKHGAVSLRIGSYHSGAYAGQTLVVITYPDWTTYGRAMQGISEDADFKRIIGEIDKTTPLEERHLTVTEEYMT